MTATAESSVTLPSGETISALGQGTWHFAERPEHRASEITALRLGIDLGMTVIDTAEMYADGAAEVLVGEAIADCHDDVFLVSKVLPNHASRTATIAACEASLKRLGTDRIDLYLLHWRGNYALEDTLTVSKPTISRHLKMLEEAGVVSRVIDGRTHRLALRPQALVEASDWIESQRERWERLFDVVGDYLEERKELR